MFDNQGSNFLEINAAQTFLEDNEGNLWPILARNIGDFWKRWHISLSTWFRDYVYIPLGGNRGGVIRTYANMAATMVISGLWHGAQWTFVIWGALHGLYLIVGDATKAARQLRIGRSTFYRKLSKHGLVGRRALATAGVGAPNAIR